MIAAALGALTAGIRLRHDLTIADVCPEIGVVPVCGIVLVSNLAILGYGTWFPRAPRALFYVGGFPALVFPVLGSVGEFRSSNVCHGTLLSSVPDCYVMAGLAVLLVGFFVYLNVGTRAKTV